MVFAYLRRLINRPLKFEEFEHLMRQSIFVSATPAEYEREHQGQVVEQVVRPTGLVDPEIVVRPALSQVDDLLGEIRLRAARNERVSGYHVGPNAWLRN